VKSREGSDLEQPDHVVGGEATDDAKEEKEDAKLSVFADEQRSDKIRLPNWTNVKSPDEILGLFGHHSLVSSGTAFNGPAPNSSKRIVRWSLGGRRP
jgi:hypothetical protein